MSDPDHHAEMESHYAAGRQIQDLELEIERLTTELQYIYDNGIEIGGDECAEVARRALEEKT